MKQKIIKVNLFYYIFNVIKEQKILILAYSDKFVISWYNTPHVWIIERKILLKKKIKAFISFPRVLSMLFSLEVSPLTLYAIILWFSSSFTCILPDPHLSKKFGWFQQFSNITFNLKNSAGSLFDQIKCVCFVVSGKHPIIN